MKIVIEKGIPIPNKKSGGRGRIYPWDELQVGESFFLENRKVTSLGPMATKAGIKRGKTFTLRTVGNGVRIWRVA